jgi:hypothetical protein
MRQSINLSFVAFQPSLILSGKNGCGLTLRVAERASSSWNLIQLMGSKGQLSTFSSLGKQNEAWLCLFDFTINCFYWIKCHFFHRKTPSLLVNGRTSLAYSSNAKSAVRSALSLLGAKLWTFKLWLSKSPVSLPLSLAPCLPLAFPLPGATHDSAIPSHPQQPPDSAAFC